MAPQTSCFSDSGNVIKPQKTFVPPKGENGTLKKPATPEVLEKFMSPFKGWSDVQVHDFTAELLPNAGQGLF